MKKLLYTFFFGYFELKWRRLFRTLLIIPYCSFALLLYKDILLISIPIVPIALISWVIKPFVVKEK